MKFDGVTFSDDKIRIPLLIFLLSFCIYVAFVILHDLQFIYDEGSYSIMVKEFSDNPGNFLPTITQTYVEWKPPLFTWVYASFYFVLKFLPISIEAVYRLPSAFFAAASVSLVYLISMRVYGYNKQAGIAAAILFFSSPLVIFASSLAMMEALAAFLSLLAIFFYMRKEFRSGAIILGLMALTKWLYVFLPMVFIAAYFYRDEALKRALLSFLAVPLFFVCYLLFSFLVGSLDTAITMLLLDLSRPSVTFSFARIIYNLCDFLAVTLPLSVPLLFFLFKEKKITGPELAIVSICILAFVLPISSMYLIWYSTPFLFAFALYVGKRIADEPDNRFFFCLISLFTLVNVVIFFLQFQILFNPDFSLRQITASIKNQTYYFIETGSAYINWHPVDSMYAGTDKEYLTLEQHNPGFLFYRFNDSSDYNNVITVLTRFNQTAGCDHPAIVHGNESAVKSAVPDCLVFVSRIGSYSVYR